MEFAEYIILGIIIAICVFIIVSRIKKIKKGQYCDCGCQNCKSYCKEIKDDTTSSNS